MHISKTPLGIQIVTKELSARQWPTPTSHEPDSPLWDFLVATSSKYLSHLVEDKRLVCVDINRFHEVQWSFRKV